MLEIRPNCECCDTNLAADSTEAMICTYECTFCRTCVEEILENVCPNCGGGFCARPIRPESSWREGLSIDHQPASQHRVNTKYTRDELKAFSAKIKNIKPQHR
jgi:hypothetical protein